MKNPALCGTGIKKLRIENEKLTINTKRESKKSEIPKSEIRNFPVAFPPAITDVTDNCHWHKGEIKNSGVQSFGRFFAELLCSAGANGTLRKCNVKREK
jgi:hypothetical protein